MRIKSRALIASALIAALAFIASAVHADQLNCGLSVTSPSFCTKFSERVYITALGCEIAFGTMELQAAGAGGL